MAERKNYTENLIKVYSKLSSLETISQYQENHLSNIDQHLNKLNDRTNKNENDIAALKAWRDVADPTKNPSLMRKVLKNGINYGGKATLIAAICTGLYYILLALGWLPIMEDDTNGHAYYKSQDPETAEISDYTSGSTLTVDPDGDGLVKVK